MSNNYESGWCKIRFQCSKISWRLFLSIWPISISSFESSFSIRRCTSGLFSCIGRTSGSCRWLLWRLIWWLQNILLLCIAIVIGSESMTFLSFKLYSDWLMPKPIQVNSLFDEWDVWSESVRKISWDKRSSDKNYISNQQAFSQLSSGPSGHTGIYAQTRRYRTGVRSGQSDESHIPHSFCNLGHNT